MTILTDSFVPFHALLFWLRIKVVDECFILNNELWSNAGPRRYRLRSSSETCVQFCVSILDTIWQKLCSYARMHKIFRPTDQKSQCARRVLSLATIRIKYYFNFILNRSRSGRELFDRPSYETRNIAVFILMVMPLWRRIDSSTERCRSWRDTYELPPFPKSLSCKHSAD